MTDTAAAPLEQRLRHARITAVNDDLSEPQTEKRTRHIVRIEVMAESADALAKARVALDSYERDRMGDSAPCHECQRWIDHEPNCPIGAALEAMK